MEINIEDLGRYLLQHILVNHTGEILAADDIDYYPEDSLFQKKTGSYKHSSYFLKHPTSVFSIENIGIKFPYSYLNIESDSLDEQIIENEETEPCEMCGKPITYGFSLCDSCDETVNYMRDDGMYILKNGKMVNTLKHVKGVDY